MNKNRLHPYVLFFLFFLAAGLHVCAQVDQPVIAYVTVQGSKQGNFKGSSNQKGRDGIIECVGFSYGIQSPRDPSSGLPTGKRMHSPVVIVKHLDAASPQLLDAAFTNENLKTVTIEFYHMDNKGRSSVFQTIRLMNASVSKVSQYGGTSSPEKLAPNTNPYEEVSFTFQKITIENSEGKTTAADDWSAN